MRANTECKTAMEAPALNTQRAARSHLHEPEITGTIEAWTGLIKTSPSTSGEGRTL
jgi:hypothetical protein